MLVRLVELPRIKKAFKFFDCWAHSTCGRCMEARSEGRTYVPSLHQRLNKVLRQLNGECFSDISARVEQGNLESVQRLVQANPSFPKHRTLPKKLPTVSLVPVC